MQKFDLSGKLTFCLFISFCLGLILGKTFSCFSIFVGLALSALTVSYIFYRKASLLKSDICLLFLFLFLGSASFIASSSKDIDAYIGRENLISFQAISLPQGKGQRNTLDAKLKRINNSSVDLKVKVMDYSKSLEYLNLYQLKGKITRHKFNRYTFYNLWVKSDSDIRRLPLNSIDRFRKGVSTYLFTVFKENCSDKTYRFLSSIFLGRRELLSREEKDSFSKAGVSHLLAISGLHLGLCSMIIFFGLRFFNLHFRIRLIVSLIFLYIYTFLTGAQPSTLRAVIMFSSFVSGFLMQRKTNTLNSLGLAGFIILIIEPVMIFNIGFQLSFTAVFAIIIGFKIFKIKTPRNVIISYLKCIFFSSLFVSILLLPLVSYYFGKINVLSVFYNLILIPFFTCIMIVIFLLIVFSPFSFIAGSLGYMLSLFVHFFINFVNLCGVFKFSYIAYRFEHHEVLLYYFALSIILTLFLLKRHHKTCFQRGNGSRVAQN